MRLKLTLLCVLIVALGTLTCVSVDADPALTISLYKNNGYGFGDDMSGLWTVNTGPPSDTLKVDFYLDDELQEVDTSAPFSWQFNTGDYPIGVHTIKAIAYGAAGDSYTAEIQRNFVEDNTNTVVFITIGVVVVVFAVATVLAVIKIRKSKK